MSWCRCCGRRCRPTRRRQVQKWQSDFQWHLQGVLGGAHVDAEREGHGPRAFRHHQQQEICKQPRSPVSLP